jgi:hypothetical protein
LPQLDPDSEYFKVDQLTAFAHQVARSLLGAGLPPNQPKVKLLFSNAADATFAGAAILDTDLQVSVLDHPFQSAPQDGAFVVVGPKAETTEADVPAAALQRLLDLADTRLIILINPRVEAASCLSAFEPAYLMRPLSVGYLRNQFAKQVERVRACLLRCYPHEWSVLFEQPDAPPRQRWEYAGRFTTQPKQAQLEELLRAKLTSVRDRDVGSL